MTQNANILATLLSDWATEWHLPPIVAFQLMYSKYCSSKEKHEFVKYYWRWHYTSWEEMWIDWESRLAQLGLVKTHEITRMKYWKENVDEIESQTGLDMLNFTFNL